MTSPTAAMEGDVPARKKSVVRVKASHCLAVTFTRKESKPKNLPWLDSKSEDRSASDQPFRGFPRDLKAPQVLPGSRC